MRRAIILLSDGDDNMSHVTREEAIEMAQRAEVIIYTISTNITGGARHTGDKVLERIADATGGRAFFPFQLNDVANAFVEIQEELRSQYALSYKPADLRTDGRLPYHRDPGAKPQRPARAQPARLLRAHPIGRPHGRILRHSPSQETWPQAAIPDGVSPVARRRKDQS